MRPSKVFLLEVLLLFVGYGHSHQENLCPVDVCRASHSVNSTCAQLLEVQQCLLDVPPPTADCGPATVYLFLINREVESRNCVPTPNPTPSLASPSSTPSLLEASPSSTSGGLPSPPPTTCPTISTDPPVTLDDADIVPNSTSHDCLPQPRSSTMEHCSALTFSHVRPFKSHHAGILTCSLPGAWYLLKHSTFSVQVEGEARTADLPLTVLKKVNVTFSSHSCSPQRTYIADSSLPLPSTFADGSTSSSDALQLTVGNNVTSLLATWLNTTIVLRQYAGYLSVTIQLPGHQAFESEGLCTGCPPHTHIDIAQALAMDQRNCVSENNIAAINCYTRGGVTHFGELVRNASYSDACIFDVLRAGTLDILSLVRATTGDARALPPIGFVPRPESTDSSPRFPFPPTEPSVENPTTVEATEQSPTTQRIETPHSRQTGSQMKATSAALLVGVSSALSQSCHLLNLLAVLVTTLLAALLR